MPASIDITKLIRGAAAARERALSAAADALEIAGEHVLGDAQQICPVSDPMLGAHSGTLKASATAEPAAWQGERLEKVIGFNTDYAAAVHEVLTARHAPPTQAKFLETALRQSGPKATEFVAAKVKEAMG